MFVYLGCGKTRRVVAVRNNLLELERNVERESRLDKRVGRLRKGKSSELSQGYERISLGWTCNCAHGFFFFNIILRPIEHYLITYTYFSSMDKAVTRHSYVRRV